MRRYSEAEKAFEEAARLAPDDEDLSRMALLRWLRDGTTDGWGPFLERNPTSLPGWEVAMTEGRYQDAAAVLDGLPDVIPNPNYLYPKPLLSAETMDALGQHEAARQSFQDAAGILETMIREEPDDERRHASLAWAYAGLMMGEEAVGEAQTAVAILPRERDAFQGPNRLFDLASVYARLGEVDKALAVLEDLLSAPAQFSPQMLEHHFRLRPIQDDPRFKALMDREKDRVF
jgi:tetratricopeptide (TPR) repeat protein